MLIKGRRGGVVTQRTANPWTPVRIRSSPPFIITTESLVDLMSYLVNKEYILNIIKKIDYPGNLDLIEKIESINVSEQAVKIIVNSEFTSNTEKLTRLWQSIIEKIVKLQVAL